jgi:hypothetical protein
VLPTGSEGKLVHIQVANESEDLLEWVIGDGVARLARLGAGVIRARSSSPRIRATLRRSGFVSIRSEPVYWWGDDAPRTGEPLRLSYLRADDAFSFESAFRSA